MEEGESGNGMGQDLGVGKGWAGFESGAGGLRTKDLGVETEQPWKRVHYVHTYLWE